MFPRLHRQHLCVAARRGVVTHGSRSRKTKSLEGGAGSARGRKHGRDRMSEGRPRRVASTPMVEPLHIIPLSTPSGSRSATGPTKLATTPEDEKGFVRIVAKPLADGPPRSFRTRARGAEP